MFENFKYYFIFKFILKFSKNFLNSQNFFEILKSFLKFSNTFWSSQILFEVLKLFEILRWFLILQTTRKEKTQSSY